MRQVAVAALAMGLVMAGCSASNHTAISLGDQGSPSVLNCGTWVTNVRASDADTGREIWSAEAVETGDGVNSLARVDVGVLPRAWSETGPAAIGARPERWRFDIGTIGQDVKMVVRDSELQEDLVVRPGDQVESRTHFKQQTCSGIPISPNVGRGLFIAIVGCAVGGAVLLALRRRRSLERIAA